MNQVNFETISKIPSISSPVGYYKVIDTEGRFWGRFWVVKNRIGDKAVIAVNEVGKPY